MRLCTSAAVDSPVMPLIISVKPPELLGISLRSGRREGGALAAALAMKPASCSIIRFLSIREELTAVSAVGDGDSAVAFAIKDEL